MSEEDTSLTSINTTEFINRSRVKEYALQMSRDYRAGKFERVGMSFLERVNDKVRQLILSEVRSHPSIGKTLK